MIRVCKDGSAIEHKHKPDDHKTNVQVTASIFFFFLRKKAHFCTSFVNLSFSLTLKPTRSV